TVFEDEFCRFAWTIRDKSIAFKVTNLSSSVLTVPTVGGRYVDEKGDSHELFITTRLYRGGPRDPQPIAPHSSQVINVYPRDYLRFKDHYVSPTRGLFAGPAFAKTPDGVIRLGSANLGRTVQLSIPLLFADRQYEYRFRFKLVKVGARQYRDYM